MNHSSQIVIQGGWLTRQLIDSVAALAGAGTCEPCGDRVVRLRDLAAWPNPARVARITALCAAARADVAFVANPRRLDTYKLAVMDMDSTLITIECIDEIADLQGLKPAVSAITAAAMRGELDYPESLRRRVALLRGLGVEALEQVYTERLRLSPGVELMLGRFAAAGLATLLVSGGFTFFTERLRRRLGLDDARANTLGIENGKLTGQVIGDIVDAAAKSRELLAACARLGADPADAIAIGDGANDLAMMAVAGISIAYRAKPVVRAQATHAISYNGLEAVPPLFGG